MENSKSPTDKKLTGKVNKHLSEKWQNEIINEAKETKYNMLLPNLWEKYQCDLRGPQEPIQNIENQEKRVLIWTALLARWCLGIVGGFSSSIGKSLKPIKLLAVYIYDYDQFRFNKVTGNPLHTQGEKYIKLDDLNAYFKKIGKAFDATISMPELLTDRHTRKKKLRPSVKHRDECRKVAAKLWGKYLDMTIADMIKQNEIVEVSKKSDGTLYMEKTVRNWIKDLCPNPAPGRRRRT